MKRISILSGVFAAFLITAQAQDASIEKGKQVYAYWCWNCHGEGVGKPGTTALSAKFKGSKPAILDQRTDLTPSITRFYVRKGVSIMPPFRKTEVSDTDLDALGAYLSRNMPKSEPAK